MKDAWKQCDFTGPHCIEMRNEIDRLRAALKQIAETGDILQIGGERHGQPTGSHSYNAAGHIECRRIALAALGEWHSRKPDRR